MNETLEKVVREVMEVTGEDAPDLLHEDAPVLAPQAMRPGESDGFYLVGLIGGKEVGKSALVNAIAGTEITASSSHGRGTDTAIAYVHRDAAEGLGALLEREVPGHYRLKTHDVADLRRQVLLDLPDIDSHYREHLEVTRTLLRHMLYPVWVSSVEKYADRQAQQMLTRVAAGNTPTNFLFVLNKADQVRASGADGDSSALEELRGDYAGRIARALELREPPRVFVVSATNGSRFELQGLRRVLGRHRAAQDVAASKALAEQTQDRSLVRWLQRQDLGRRAEAMARLQQEVEETLAARVGPMLLERAVPRLAEDPATQLAIADEVLGERVAHWPMVNLVHALLSPVFLLIRSATSRHAGPPRSADALVDASLRESGEPLAGAVQSSFAQLRRSHPQLGKLYEHRKLWEQLPSEMAASELSSRLAEALRRQREVARDRLGRGRWLTAPWRWLLTLGALLWFPFVQPILEAALGHQDISHWRQLVGLIVSVLGVNYLLKSAGFLLIWFLVLWLALRWNTQRRVARLMKSWKTANQPDPSVNLALHALDWMDNLSEPVRRSSDHFASLVRRAEQASAATKK